MQFSSFKTINIYRAALGFHTCTKARGGWISYNLDYPAYKFIYMLMKSSSTDNYIGNKMAPHLYEFECEVALKH